MKRARWVLVTAILMLAVVGVVAAAEDIYYCPMHPQIVSDKPGDCPICHMRLVKREAEPTTHEEHTLTAPTGFSNVSISPEQQQLMGIRTTLVERKALKNTLRTSARVAYDPDLYDAQIEYLREYRTAQGTLRNNELAFKNLVNSRWEAPRIDIAKSKLVLMGMDEDSIQELVQSAKADPALLYVEPKGKVWIYADIFESDIHWLQKSDVVHLTAPSMPDKSYEGRIHSVGSMVDPQTRRVHIHIHLQNDGFLKPGMFLDATIESSAGEALVLPREAVFFTGTAAVVFVDKGQGIFEPRKVEIGVQAGDDFAITSGLSEGEKIVVNGNFLLDSESRLKASLESAVSSNAHAGHTGRTEEL